MYIIHERQSNNGILQNGHKHHAKGNRYATHTRGNSPMRLLTTPLVKLSIYKMWASTHR